MEIVAIILGAIVLGAAGIAWDYYKPSRFRTSYRNVKSSGGTDSGGDMGDSGGGCD